MSLASTTFDDLSSQCKRLREEVKELQDADHVKERECKRLRKEVLDLKEQESRVEKIFDALRFECKRLREDQDVDLVKECENLKKEVKKLEDLSVGPHERLWKNLKEQKKMIKNLKEQNVDHVKECEKLEEQNERLRKEVNEWKTWKTSEEWEEWKERQERQPHDSPEAKMFDSIPPPSLVWTPEITDDQVRVILKVLGATPGSWLRVGATTRLDNRRLEYKFEPYNKFFDAEKLTPILTNVPKDRLAFEENRVRRINRHLDQSANLIHYEGRNSLWSAAKSSTGDVYAVPSFPRKDFPTVHDLVDALWKEGEKNRISELDLTF